MQDDNWEILLMTPPHTTFHRHGEKRALKCLGSTVQRRASKSHTCSTNHCTAKHYSLKKTCSHPGAVPQQQNTATSSHADASDTTQRCKRHRKLTKHTSEKPPTKCADAKHTHGGKKKKKGLPRQLSQILNVISLHTMSFHAPTAVTDVSQPQALT